MCGRATVVAGKAAFRGGMKCGNLSPGPSPLEFHFMYFLPHGVLFQDGPPEEGVG